MATGNVLVYRGIIVGRITAHRHNQAVAAIKRRRPELGALMEVMEQDFLQRFELEIAIINPSGMALE